MEIRRKDALQPSAGHLFILSAPSGAGKSTLCRALLDHFSDLQYSVSYTTRSPRKGEKEGVDYHFISPARFEEMIAQGKWAEWARVHGNYYGTSGEDIEKHLKAGRDVLLDIDVQGAAQILKRYPDGISVFILPPSMDALRARLDERGTDSRETIEKRLAEAENEIRQKDRYRHVIVNDRLEKAIAGLIDLVNRYRHPPQPGQA
ncbi:MAG: guanylate kinase [Deltaproteobacteria bacterium]|nr:MAG: guanylate kinase [Deltaproteobacteria bacterium]